jgi:hypothetical protein
MTGRVEVWPDKVVVWRPSGDSVILPTAERYDGRKTVPLKSTTVRTSDQKAFVTYSGNVNADGRPDVRGTVKGAACSFRFQVQ